MLTYMYDKQKEPLKLELAEYRPDVFRSRIVGIEVIWQLLGMCLTLVEKEGEVV